MYHIIIYHCLFDYYASSDKIEWVLFIDLFISVLNISLPRSVIFESFVFYGYKWCFLGSRQFLTY